MIFVKKILQPQFLRQKDYAKKALFATFASWQHECVNTKNYTKICIVYSKAQYSLEQRGKAQCSPLGPSAVHYPINPVVLSAVSPHHPCHSCLPCHPFQCRHTQLPFQKPHSLLSLVFPSVTHI